MQNFKKRVFDLPTLAQDAVAILKNAPEIIDAFQSARIDRAFAEKIMLATTSVNLCRYCSWFHSDLAIDAGANANEVEGILTGVGIENASDYEKPALLYAIHFAQTNRNPDLARLDELKDFYGEQEARDIQRFIQVIYFGNLSGNTFDAFLSRLKGRPAEGSSAAFEALFFVLGLPVVLTLANQTSGGKNPFTTLAR